MLYIFSLLLVSLQGNIEVQVTGIEEARGFMNIAIFNEETKFLSSPVKYFYVEVKSEKELRVVFENMPKGSYAISLYQDLNGNKKLDSNVFRIPKEPYGFSNNPRSRFGPPDFDEAVFEHGESLTKLKIKI